MCWKNVVFDEMAHSFLIEISIWSHNRIVFFLMNFVSKSILFLETVIKLAMNMEKKIMAIPQSDKNSIEEKK